MDTYYCDLMIDSSHIHDSIIISGSFPLNLKPYILYIYIYIHKNLPCLVHPIVQTQENEEDEMVALASQAGGEFPKRDENNTLW